jgi:hypothetical protein|uniref:Uncharacterized protein n=1 Tax=Zea mays TaxID=4577 RepID=A0A804LRC3_MAIZE
MYTTRGDHPWHGICLICGHKRRATSDSISQKLRRREGVVERPREAPFGAVRLRRLRLQHHGAQRVAEAAVAPPVADAAQHGVPVQRPRPGPQVQAARHRRRLDAAFAIVPGRGRRVLGHHGGRHALAPERERESESNR